MLLLLLPAEEPGHVSGKHPKARIGMEGNEMGSVCFGVGACTHKEADSALPHETTLTAGTFKAAGVI